MAVLAKARSRNQRVLRFLYLLLASFTLSCLPWTLVHLMIDFAPLDSGLQLLATDHLYVLLTVCYLLAMGSMAANGLLYGWCAPEIRRELRSVFPTTYQLFSRFVATFMTCGNDDARTRSYD